MVPRSEGTMCATPAVTIFVRHCTDCKYARDEFCRRCRCRKHLRWTQNGVQYRRKAGTRSWEEAEEQRRRLEDQLAGRTPGPETKGQGIQEAIDLFLLDKKVQGITDHVIGKYTRELARLRTFCESAGVYTVQGMNRDLLTQYCATWEESYPSSSTRVRVRNFLRYCYQAEWLARVIELPKIKDQEPPTMAPHRSGIHQFAGRGLRESGGAQPPRTSARAFAAHAMVRARHRGRATPAPR
jgi:integrase/recombinase XerD